MWVPTIETPGAGFRHGRSQPSTHATRRGARHRTTGANGAGRHVADSALRFPRPRRAGHRCRRRVRRVRNSRRRPPPKAVIDQHHEQFVPRVLIVQRGTEVSFPNTDRVQHHVYSFSQTKQFELPLYRGNEHPPVMFDHAGVAVLGCNIHDHMVGYVLVVDSSHFGFTDRRRTPRDRRAPQRERQGDAVASGPGRRVRRDHTDDRPGIGYERGEDRPCATLAGKSGDIVVMERLLISWRRSPDDRCRARAG